MKKTIIPRFIKSSHLAKYEVKNINIDLKDDKSLACQAQHVDLKIDNNVALPTHNLLT